MDIQEILSIRRAAFQEAIVALEKHRKEPWRPCDEGERIGLGYAISDIEKLMKADPDRVAAAATAL